MIDWIFEGIANWVASIMTQVMDAVSGVFLEALGTDMTAMEEYFPFVTAAYSIMQYTVWALLFLIVVWQLFRTFGGPITEAEHPFELLAAAPCSPSSLHMQNPFSHWCLKSRGRPTLR